MTRAQIRRAAWQAKDRVEWIDTHVTTRKPGDQRRLEDYLSDLHKLMLKIIEAPLREPQEVQARRDESPCES
jgi:hypothetical protein